MTGSGFAEVDGARLFYEVAGDGPALALCHVGVGDSRSWDDQFDVFAARHRVLRYDMRGFGRSQLPSGPYSHVDDLRQLMLVAGLERASLVGVSMGGSVSLQFALLHPELVSRLVLVAPGLPDHEWSEEVERFGRAEEEALEADDLERATELNLRTWVDGPSRAPGEVDPAVRRRVHDMQLQAFRTQVAAYERTPPPGPPMQLDPPASVRLAEVQTPTLIVVGELDVPDMLRIAERLEVGIPGARRVVIPCAAHVPNMECPTEFNRLVLDFLADSD